MSTFKYDEKLAPNQIRLIQLFPGQWLDDLESRLYLADRDHKYQALSYAWGSSKRSNQVSVNGKIHKITFNLDRALRSVRRQTEIITLWVDSICINQDDATEKGQQVGWMHDIFGSAMGVTAYIGDGLDRSRKDYSRSFEMLGQNPLVDFEPLDSWTSEPKNHLDGLRDSVPASLTEHQEIVYLFSLLMLFFYSSPFGREMMRLDQSLHQYNVEHNLSDAQLQPVIERMRLFATSDWWNRMWIVQEACAARQLTVVYGRASVPFSYIEEAAQGYLQSPTAKHPDLARVMRFLADKITPISPARRLGRTKEKVVLSATTSSSLLWLLRRFRHRKSSEPRDKIFALLKLAEDMKARRPFQHNQMTIEADYEDDVSEVFSHAAFEIIRHTGLLWMTTSDLLAKSRKDIPSWVPDWSSEYMASGFDQRRYRLQEATVLGYNAGRARFQHFRSISREDSVRNLPRQHLEALLNYDDDEWKPVHSLPTMIKYTSSPPFREKMQRSALIIKGVACSVIGVASQVIRSDLSNI
ncbi:heterokaryon incompatibility protein, partial [Colletotrichum godetiae]